MMNFLMISLMMKIKKMTLEVIFLYFLDLNMIFVIGDFLTFPIIYIGDKYEKNKC